MKEEYINKNDWVYVPSFSKKPLRVIDVKPTGERIIDGFSELVNVNGLLFGKSELYSAKVAFLATGENKAKLESLYGELDDVEDKPNLVKFKKLLDELIKLEIKREYASNSRHDDWNPTPNPIYAQRNMKYNELLEFIEELI